jgi:serine/threonine protein kinase
MSLESDSTPKEQLDSQGNTLKVDDLTFIEGILGKGSYGTVRLAVRKRPDARDDDSEHTDHRSNIKSGAVTPPSARSSQHHHHHQHHRETDRRQRSSSAPAKEDFFKKSEQEKSHYGKKTASTHSNQQNTKMHRSLSARGGFDEDDTDEELVAVKIFNKSLLKRKRTMERNKETRKVQVKTALEQVEREIALMKKLSHPNLVGFYEALDSPDSDLLYMVIEYMPLGGRYYFSLLFLGDPDDYKNNGVSLTPFHCLPLMNRNLDVPKRWNISTERTESQSGNARGIGGWTL